MTLGIKLKLDKGKVRTARRLAEIGRNDLSLALRKWARVTKSKTYTDVKKLQMWPIAE